MNKKQRIALLEARVSELEVLVDALSVQPEQKGVPIHQVMNEWINGEERDGE